MAVLSFMIQAPGDYPRAGKVCQGKNTSSLRKFVNYGRKKFLGLAPNVFV